MSLLGTGWIFRAVLNEAQLMAMITVIITDDDIERRFKYLQEIGQLAYEKKSGKVPPLRELI